VVSGPPVPAPAAARRPPRHLRWLPGVDGLRAIAVLAVIGYHAELYAGDGQILRGGFLGVDVFFVISGYLITSILLNEWRSGEHVDLFRFYGHRARRLLPAMAAAALGALVLAVLLIPGEVASLRGDVAASFGYVTNWYFIVTQKSYFETVGRPSLVQHLWSLAVEEQFYLLWPVVFVVAMRRLGRHRLMAAVGVAAVASASLMTVLHLTGADDMRLYEGTDTRASGLLIGVVVAFLWPVNRLRRQTAPSAPAVLDAVGVAAGLAVLVAIAFADEHADALYLYGFFAISMLTAVVIAVVVHPAARLGRWLSWRPLTWVGKRSYGLYLYHWPVFQLTRPGVDVPLAGAPLLGARLGITFALAGLSYRFLEMPIRTGAWRRWWGRLTDAMGRDPNGVGIAGIAGVAACAVLVYGLGVSVVQARPAPVPEYLAAGSTGGGLPPAAADPTTPPETVLAGPGGPDLSVSGPTTTAVPGPDTSVPAGAPVPAEPSTAPPTTAAPAVRRITALGDSVMLGAAPALQEQLGGDVFVDAAVGRQVGDGLGILRAWRDLGRLGDVVVIHIGNNGTFRPGQFDEMREILAGVPRVVVVNVKVPRSWEGYNNDVIAAGVQAMPNAVLVDWKGASDARPELFYGDGMHLRPEATGVYAGLVGAAL
jgi:peptidoglycan/LPS O-acetylase OafA/YrhL